MDVVTAKVLGSIALVFGIVFIATSVERLTRTDVDLLLVLLNTALGIMWLGVGVWLWRFGLCKSNSGR
ncbi:hypothetical protein [Curtobacterium sp. Leaf261]|uniref:hypothetical protein n=1 Tax=Curtobacterium sp. Leaf261 TaxID=1736311 RepID=UPI0006F73C56|nr:hypothetical protein [Curtobacterium sp. Leaf261]KQO64308.1 hypothetical protein ASF23_17260 [Curtobacterium sp. Leaf261]